MKETTLIQLYCTISTSYDKRLCADAQRMSNNSSPLFTDSECLTIYIFGIMEQRFAVKACYTFIKTYFPGWFPHLPSYQAFNNRVCRLSGVFQTLYTLLITRGGLSIGRSCVLDAMPIMAAQAPRSGSARAASEVCSKGYCASNVRNIELFADKAYTDKDWKRPLAAQGISLHTPVKLKKGQTYLGSRDSYYSSAVAQARQCIESFFNGIHERTQIQSASKIRSVQGLISFIFARLSALVFYP